MFLFEKIYLCHTWIAIEIVHKFWFFFVIFCDICYLIGTWMFLGQATCCSILSKKCLTVFFQIDRYKSSLNLQAPMNNRVLQCIQRVQLRCVFYQMIWFKQMKWYTTVDGRNPAPVNMVNIPLFIGFYTSQMVQDFFHQQYDTSLSFSFPLGQTS